MRFLAIALVLAACAGPVAGPTTTTTTNPPTETTTTTPEAPGDDESLPALPGEETAPVTGEVPASILDPILSDAADRTGLPVGDLVVIRSEFLEWPDGSLGCPEPDMVYPQVITPGYWVQIDAGGTTLDYRAGDRGFFRLCENPGKPPIGGNPDA